MTRLTIHFSGRVQGVGFRYTTARVAQRFAVSGYVMNLPDGRVKCVVEAEKAEAAAFLADVKAAMERNIEATDVVTGDAAGEFDGFAVRH